MRFKFVFLAIVSSYNICVTCVNFSSKGPRIHIVSMTSELNAQSPKLIKKACVLSIPSAGANNIPLHFYGASAEYANMHGSYFAKFWRYFSTILSAHNYFK